MSEQSAWNRRAFLKAGASGAAAASLGCATVSAGATPGSTPRFHTALCDLLGIQYPILQAGMGGVAGVQLAAAVSQAGGLGILAAAHAAPDEVRRRIQELRGLTDRPFSVNLLLHPQMWPPVDASKIPENVIQAVQTALNRFRERLGLAPVFARPPNRPNHIPGSIEVILEERVPVFSIGMGSPPPELVARFHAQGAKVIAMASTVDDARQLAAAGVDAIVAQGYEAGGHRSTWAKGPSSEHRQIGTMALVPRLAETVGVPVIAAGGIADGRAIVAALALGAKGALLGTRFVAARESLAPDFYKQTLVDQDSDGTTVTDAYSGLYARVLRNRYTDEYAASGAPALPGFLQATAAGDITRAAAARMDREHYPMWAGQGLGLIRDVPGAGEIMQALVREARDVLSRFPEAVQLA